jgi:hypothetical protein
MIPNRCFASLLLACSAVIAVPVAARAQDEGKGFLFGAPLGSLTIRGGWALARARSDFFAFTTERLTLDRSDFSSPAIEGDLAFRVTPRTDIVISSGLSGMDRRSEYRGFIDNNDQPIEQTTTFRRVPITLGVRQYLTPTGRSIGRFAWIPTRLAPYVGAGGGIMYYKFRQDGDFIDPSLNVFSSVYESDGWTRTMHVLAGIDYSLGPRFALNSEARYLWSNAELSRDFSGFDRLDLSGLSTTIGLSVRF